MAGRDNKPKRASQRAVEAALIWAALALLFAFAGFRFAEMPGWYMLVIIGVPAILAAAYYVLSSRKAAPPAQKPAESAPEKTPQRKHFMDVIDEMEGREFEFFCGELLEKCGYENVFVTRASGDQGVDIIAYKNNIRYAFQCKRYDEKVSNKAVQEVNTGRNMYSCFGAVVITNSYFTRGAKDLAKVSHVELWDRDILMDKIRRVIKTEQALRKMHADAEEKMRKAERETSKV